MPKSKQRLKRRKKVKGKTVIQRKSYKGWDGKGGYTKTDGQSRVCLYDKNHNFIRFAEEPMNQ